MEFKLPAPGKLYLPKVLTENSENQRVKELRDQIRRAVSICHMKRLKEIVDEIEKEGELAQEMKVEVNFCK